MLNLDPLVTEYVCMYVTKVYYIYKHMPLSLPVSLRVPWLQNEINTFLALNILHYINVRVSLSVQVRVPWLYNKINISITMNILYIYT